MTDQEMFIIKTLHSCSGSCIAVDTRREFFVCAAPSTDTIYCIIKQFEVTGNVRAKGRKQFCSSEA
jgi:hypothetical protein